MISQNKKSAIIFSIVLSAVFTLSNTALIFFAGAGLKMMNLIVSLVWLAVSVFLMILSKTRPLKIKSFIIFIISVLLAAGLGTTLLFPMPCSSDKSYFYRFQRTYEKFFNYEINSFPEKLPSDITDYNFYSMSGFMQANSIADLIFRTADKEYIRSVKNDAVANALYTIKLSDYNSTRNTTEAAEDTSYSKIYFSTSYISELTDDATIYLMSYSDSEKYDYVIISNDECIIQYGNRGD